MYNSLNDTTFYEQYTWSRNYSGYMVPENQEGET